MTSTEIYRETTRHFLAPVIELLDDPSVSEIMINGPHQIYFERAGQLHPWTGKTFRDDRELAAAARNIAEFSGRTLDARNQLVDARLPDGSRVNIAAPPSSRVGLCVTIRRFQKNTFSLRKLVERGSLPEDAARQLSRFVRGHKNLVVSGGTGTGKTSMLNALSAAIPANERIIVIEDTSELQLRQPHTVYLEAQGADLHGRGAVSIRDLFVNSLRMRPDRIVVGEVRRGEALDLIQSMLSGHDGALTTVHASTPRDALNRLETLCMMSDVAIPVQVARAQVASAVSIVLQLARLPDGSRRAIGVAEALGLDDAGNYVLQDLYRFEFQGRDAAGKIQGTLTPTGVAATFQAELDAVGADAALD